jgi:putative PEP-CTERM system histidine kinase
MLGSKLRVFINKNFFSYRYDYREEWLRFTNLLTTRDATVSPAQRSIQALANLVESPGGALWLRGEDGVFTQTARANVAEVRAREPADGPLGRFLRASGWVVDLEEYRREPSRYPELELPEWLKNMPGAWLLVPIIAQAELTGFIVLANPRAAVELNWEVRDLLKTAARQLGSFLAQLQASEALLDARKLEAFNRMTAFVVHDLKNLVAQLSLLLKNAERHRLNPRFQDDMLSTVKHVAERMNKLLLQLSAGSRGEEHIRPIALGNLIRRIAASKAEPMRIDTREGVLVLAHEQRLERVIGHLVQNAIDATRGGGDVHLQLYAQDSHAVLEVVDTGCGMSEQFVREKLFRPFQTTKPSGMGIGAYEVSQYVGEIGGLMEVESKPAAGTRIKVMLPLYQEHASHLAQAREVA